MPSTDPGQSVDLEAIYQLLTDIDDSLHSARIVTYRQLVAQARDAVSDHGELTRMQTRLDRIEHALASVQHQVAAMTCAAC